MLFYAGILALYWPRWTEQFACGQGNEVREGVRRMTLGWIAVALTLGVVLMAGFEAVCRTWLQDPLFSVPADTVLWMAGVLVARTMQETFVTALLAASRPGSVTAVIMLQAAITITAQILLYPYFGVNSLFVGVVLGTLFSSGWLLPLMLRPITSASTHCPS